MKNNVSISIVLMFFPTLAHADGVMSLSGILVFAFIFFVLIGFLLYGLICSLAKVGGKSKIDDKHNHEK